jgi:transcription elongation factor Elf1
LKAGKVVNWQIAPQTAIKTIVRTGCRAGVYWARLRPLFCLPKDVDLSLAEAARRRPGSGSFLGASGGHSHYISGPVDQLSSQREARIARKRASPATYRDPTKKSLTPKDVPGEPPLRSHVIMTELYVWLQKMTGGDETRASIVAASIAVIGAIFLGVAIYYGTMALLERLLVKDRCLGCGRRSLTVCWFDENDEEEVEYQFFRCHSCGARYKQRPGEVWEDASDAKFDAMFIGDSRASRADPLWDNELDACQVLISGWDNAIARTEFTGRPQ